MQEIIKLLSTAYLNKLRREEWDDYLAVYGKKCKEEKNFSFNESSDRTYSDKTLLLFLPILEQAMVIRDLPIRDLMRDFGFSNGDIETIIKLYCRKK